MPEGKAVGGGVIHSEPGFKAGGSDAAPPKPPGAPAPAPAGGVSQLIVELAVNLVLPYLVYTFAVGRWGEFDALAGSAAPPALWNLYELARFRKIDALSLVVLGGIGLSMLAVLLGGSPRMLMVRENLFSVPIGLAFLVTAPMRRPLLYHIASAIFARSDPAGHSGLLRAFERPAVVRGLRVMSVVWGVGLAGQGALLGWMALWCDIPTYLLISPVIGYGAVVAMGVWTYWYSGKLQR